MFELAKLDSREIQPRSKPFSLGELAQDVTQKFQLAAERKNIRLQTRIEMTLPFVSGDIGLIERVLENLIENAIRFTPDSGTVTIGVANQNGWVATTVSDTGPGISETDIPLIFDRYYRVEKNNRSEGTGLGLAIAKRIIELHESIIDVVSTPKSGVHDPATPEGFIHIHSGIHGIADLEPSLYDWRNPAATVTIQRIP